MGCIDACHNQLNYADNLLEKTYGKSQPCKGNQCTKLDTILLKCFPLMSELREGHWFKSNYVVSISYKAPFETGNDQKKEVVIMIRGPLVHAVIIEKYTRIVTLSLFLLIMVRPFKFFLVLEHTTWFNIKVFGPLEIRSCILHVVSVFAFRKFCSAWDPLLDRLISCSNTLRGGYGVGMGI